MNDINGVFINKYNLSVPVTGDYNTISDRPSNDWYFIEVDALVKNSSEKLVKAYRIPGGTLKTATYVGGVWSDWA